MITVYFWCNFYLKQFIDFRDGHTELTGCSWWLQGRAGDA